MNMRVYFCDAQTSTGRQLGLASTISLDVSGGYSLQESKLLNPRASSVAEMHTIIDGFTHINNRVKVCFVCGTVGHRAFECPDCVETDKDEKKRTLRKNVTFAPERAQRRSQLLIGINLRVEKA